MLLFKIVLNFLRLLLWPSIWPILACGLAKCFSLKKYTSAHDICIIKAASMILLKTIHKLAPVTSPKQSIHFIDSGAEVIQRKLVPQSLHIISVSAMAPFSWTAVVSVTWDNDIFFGVFCLISSFLQRCIVDDFKILLTQTCTRFKCDSLTLHSSLHLNITFVTLSSKNPSNHQGNDDFQIFFFQSIRESKYKSKSEENKIKHQVENLSFLHLLQLLVRLSTSLTHHTFYLKILNPLLTVYSYRLLLHCSNCKHKRSIKMEKYTLEIIRGKPPPCRHQRGY